MPPSDRQYVIELEHELAELREALADKDLEFKDIAQSDRSLSSGDGNAPHHRHSTSQTLLCLAVHFGSLQFLTRIRIKPPVLHAAQIHFFVARHPSYNRNHYRDDPADDNNTVAIRTPPPNAIANEPQINPPSFQAPLMIAQTPPNKMKARRAVSMFQPQL
jgi:hypothetical protein